MGKREAGIPNLANTVLLKTLQLHGLDDNLLSERVTALPSHGRRCPRGSTIVAGGPAPNESCLILSGFAAREVLLADGKRQLAGCYIRGDFVDLCALVLDELDHNVVALTDVEVAFYPHSALKKLCSDSPILNRLLWRLTAVDASIQRAWLTSNSRRQSSDRLAHFLCEQNARLSMIGMAQDGSFELPISQLVLSDVLGLSTVQMNRSIQLLRNERSIIWKGPRVSIDSVTLSKRCGFDPGYLNLDRAG